MIKSKVVADSVSLLVCYSVSLLVIERRDYFEFGGVLLPPSYHRHLLVLAVLLLLCLRSARKSSEI